MQVVNDWLNERKLDRKALIALAANAQAYEDYNQHTAYEVALLLNDMVGQLAGEPPRVRHLIVFRDAYSCHSLSLAGMIVAVP
jgi:hypothetical protein